MAVEINRQGAVTCRNFGPDRMPSRRPEPASPPAPDDHLQRRLAECHFCHAAHLVGRQMAVYQQRIFPFRVSSAFVTAAHPCTGGAASLRRDDQPGARMRFEGTAAYVADKDLMVAVNAAIALERPLLSRASPEPARPNSPARWHRPGARSHRMARQIDDAGAAGLYEYDAVSRLRDSQLGDARFNDIKNYIKRGKLWEAFAAGRKVVLLIDEIDKADIEFPQRPAAGTRPDGVLRLRDRRNHPRRRPPDRHHNLQQREGLPDASCAAASSTTSAFPKSTRCTGSSTSTIPHQAEPGAGGAHPVLTKSATCRTEEEAVDLRSAGLDKAARHR